MYMLSITNIQTPPRKKYATSQDYMTWIDKPISASKIVKNWIKLRLVCSRGECESFGHIWREDCFSLTLEIENLTQYHLKLSWADLSEINFSHGTKMYDYDDDLPIEIPSLTTVLIPLWCFCNYNPNENLSKISDVLTIPITKMIISISQELIVSPEDII